MDKPVCQPCLRNQEPIYRCLAKHFVDEGKVLELASGTGQHCVYFSQRMPHLTWQTSELPNNLEGIHAWLQDAQLGNTPAPIALDITQDPWPTDHIDYGFCANLLHFVSSNTVKTLFQRMSSILRSGGLLACYGPINENGYTSEGNKQLDAWLKQDIDPSAGIKEKKDLIAWADKASLKLVTIERLPANNVILILKKR